MNLKVFSRNLIGILISLFFIVLIFHQINIAKTIQAFGGINLIYILLIIPVYYFSFWVRAYRWDVILSDDKPFKMSSLISTVFIGYMANSFFPARMGDVYRSYLLGKSEGISRLKVFTSVVLERIFDGSVLVILLLAVIAKICSKPWVVHLSVAAGVVFVGGFIVFLIFAKFGKSDNLGAFLNKFFKILPVFLQKPFNYTVKKLARHYESFIAGLEIFNHPAKLFNAIFLTVIIWSIEGALMFMVIKSFGVTIGFLSIVFSLCIIVFSTMIPAGPASIGPYQYGYILALGVFGVHKEIALAMSIVNQFTSIILISIAGIFCIYKYHINIKALEEEIKIPLPEIREEG